MALYYPLLLFHLGTNASGDLGSTKRDYMGLGTVVKDIGPHVLFFFILLVRRKGLRRTVDPTCQQLVAQLVLAAEVPFQGPWDPL